MTCTTRRPSSGGVDESRAWGWLLSIVDYHRPDLLISLGDWGYAVNFDEFYELLERVRVWSIYGNHDNLDVLELLRNKLADKPEPVLIKDGGVREFGGLRFGAINGVAALGKKDKRALHGSIQRSLWRLLGVLGAR